MESTSQRVKDWLSVVCESPKTFESYSKGWAIFENFCSERGKNAAILVDDYRAIKYQGEIPREQFLEEWQDILSSYHPYLKTKYASLVVKQLLVIVKSFLRKWKIPLEVDLPRHSYVTYHNRDLRKAEIEHILTFATPRDKVIYLLMVESGLRVGTAIRLKYWQIKEDFENKRVPMKIVLPSSELKDHVGDRWTFIGADGFRELSRYLAGRLPLKDDDFVFTSEKEGLVKREQFSTASLSTKFNRIVQKLNICASNNGKPKKIRLHGLRKYFRNNMRADSAFIEFWMGHSLGVDAHYISRDPEEHRKRYKEGYNYLKIYEGNAEDLNDLYQKLQEREQEIGDLKTQMQALQEKDKELQDIRSQMQRMYDIMKSAFPELLERQEEGLRKALEEKPEVKEELSRQVENLPSLKKRKDS